MSDADRIDAHRRRWVAHRSRVKREAGKRAKRDLKEARRLWARMKASIPYCNVVGSTAHELDKLLTEDER